METHVAVALIVCCGLLVLAMLFFAFEKPLRKLYLKWSDKRFEKRTGIDMKRFPPEP